MGIFLNTTSVQYITVDDEFIGQRLDNFLFRHFKGVPKTHIYRIIRSGEVRINKGRVSAESRLAQGDVVRLPPLRLPDVAAKAEQWVPAAEFPILFEDDGLLIIDKPAGVAVHGGSGVNFGVIEQLRQSRPTAKCLELVHRLDRDTSGILVVAKKRSALRHLQDQFRTRQIGKTYLALAHGEWPAKQQTIDVALQKYLLPNGERRVKTVPADHPDAMRSISLVKRNSMHEKHLQSKASLLEVTIKTGRTHQIRVHLSSAGHPIAGDDKYGLDAWNHQLSQLGFDRMFLHAWRLEFSHPDDMRRIQLSATLPLNLVKMLDKWQETK